MTWLLLLALAADPQTSYTSLSNAFEPSEFASEAIYVGVQVCMNRNGGTTKTNLVYCGCMMDAARANSRTKKPPENNVSMEQTNVCAKRAKAVAESKDKPDAGRKP